MKNQKSYFLLILLIIQNLRFNSVDAQIADTKIKSIIQNTTFKILREKMQSFYEDTNYCLDTNFAKSNSISTNQKVATCLGENY